MLGGKICKVTVFIVSITPCNPLCTYPFSSHHGGCYYASRQTGNISGCQKICAEVGGTLASIGSRSLNHILAAFLVESDIPNAFIGMYERGDEETGDWVWSDGLVSNYSHWAPGEPNNWCVDEDCVIILGNPSIDAGSRLPVQRRHEGYWYDVSCSLSFQCLCQHGRSASFDFESKQINLSSPVEEERYDQCYNKMKQCSWYEDEQFHYMLLMICIPCALAMTYTLTATIVVGLGYRTTSKAALRDRVFVSSLYGGLLRSSERKGHDSNDAVNRWVVRGAWGLIFHALALSALASTTSFHFSGIPFGFIPDTFCAIAMFLCKSTVSFSAVVVYWNLSPFSRAVTSWWICFIALAKLGLALCTLMLVIEYLKLALRGDGKLPSLCNWGYSFCSTLVASFVCECAAALALCRLQERAAAHAGDSNVFSNIVGCSWFLLVAGTLGAGLGLGAVAAVFVFHDPHDYYFTPYMAFALFYLGAGVCQFFAGTGLLRANVQIRAFFAKSMEGLVCEEGGNLCAQVEMSDRGSMEAVDEDAFSSESVAAYVLS